jgi:hypothetical protein
VNEVVETQRYVWTTDELHSLHVETKLHAIWSIEEKERGRLPAIMALPFCWRAKVKDLESRYDIALMDYRADGWLLRFSPRTQDDKRWFSVAYLYLDKSTYLPRRFFLYTLTPNYTHDFRITDIRQVHIAPDDLLAIPDGRDWHVGRMDEVAYPRWLSAWRSMELLP